MHPPYDKREPRPFEPPPWELEQSAEPKEAAEHETAGTEEAASPAEEKKEPKLTESQMDTMIIGLSAEEGPTARNLFGCGVAASLVSGFVGAVILVYAVVVYARTASAGAVAVFGPLALGMTGTAILATSIWLAVRTYGRRGA